MYYCIAPFHGLLPELSVTSENRRIILKVYFRIISLLIDATVAMAYVYLCKHILTVIRDALS